MTERMYGIGYIRDERIKAAMDESGNHSFIFTLILLWCALVWSLLTKKTSVMYPTFIIFMLANIFYLINLIRKGALHYKLDGAQKPVDSRKRILALACGGAVFGMANLLFKKFSDPAAFSEQLLANIIASGVMAVLWVPLFLGLMKVFAWLSTRITEKKVSPE